MPISASAVCSYLLICLQTFGVDIWRKMSSFEPLSRGQDISNIISFYSPGPLNSLRAYLPDCYFADQIQIMRLSAVI